MKKWSEQWINGTNYRILRVFESTLRRMSVLIFFIEFGAKAKGYFPITIFIMFGHRRLEFISGSEWKQLYSMDVIAMTCQQVWKAFDSNLSYRCVCASQNLCRISIRKANTIDAEFKASIQLT